MKHMAKSALAASLVALAFASPATAQGEVAGEIIEVVGLQAHPSDVDIGNPTLWPEINVNPYQGNVTQASAILSPKTNIRPLERAEAWQMRMRGECHAYQLKPGDITRTTFGENHTMLAEVGFTGMADVCVIRPDGTAVVFPRDCANIGDALAIVRRQVVRELEYVYAPPPPQPRLPVRITNSAVPSDDPYTGSSTLLLSIPGVRYRGGDTNIDARVSAKAGAAVNAGATSCASAGKTC